MVDELVNSTSSESAETEAVAEETVYESAPQRKKPIIIGLVATALVVIIGGGAVLYLRGMIALPGRPTPLPKVMEKIKNSQTKCDESKDKAKCLSELTLDEAVAGHQAEACEKIEKIELKDGCFDTIARELGEIKICERISFQAAKDSCMGSILFAQAKESKDISLCAGIVSERFKNACYVFVFNAVGTLDFCKDAGDRSAECVATVAFRDAIAAADPALCAPIAEAEARTSCEADVSNLQTNLDSDKDGLTDAEETQYGTDKNNPDTDGDGYKDGAEVKAGYNPKGSGRLP